MAKQCTTPESCRFVVPFLKWAGGKRWLVSSHQHLFPNSFKAYYEPFVGSGASFFYLQPSKAILSDINGDLINAYNAIKHDWAAVHKTLKHYHDQHCKEFYYQIRAKIFTDESEKAAQFIYLNRTCWNGLYRVSLNGNFNVPIGTKKNVLLNTDNFERISNLLQCADIKQSDFEEVIESAATNDFVFIDPPYTVKHNLNGFVKYNEKIFSWDDQVRLRDSVEKALSRGAKVLLTNADHEDVRKLYSNIGSMMSLDRLSVISGDKSSRGRYSELVVKCY